MQKQLKCLVVASLLSLGLAGPLAAKPAMRIQFVSETTDTGDFTTKYIVANKFADAVKKYINDNTVQGLINKLTAEATKGGGVNYNAGTFISRFTTASGEKLKMTINTNRNIVKIMNGNDELFRVNKAGSSSSAPVPGPIAGAGLPVLAAMFGFWAYRNRRRTTTV